MKPGLYPDMSRDDYDKVDAAHYSILKHFHLSAKEARHQELNRPEPTAAMDLGNALHTAVWEPDLLNDRYAAAPEVDRRTKVGKATWAAFQVEHPDHIILRAQEWESVVAMRDAVRAWPTARKLIESPGVNEASLFWMQEDFFCKARLDRYCKDDGWPCIVDIKTTSRISVHGFSTQCYELGYHIQMGFYYSGLDALASAQRRYKVIVVENSAPWDVRVCEPSLRMVELGKKLSNAYLLQYKDCVASGSWPGIGDGWLDLPEWVYKVWESE